LREEFFAAAGNDSGNSLLQTLYHRAHRALGSEEIRAYESGFKTVAHWARTDSAFDSMSGDQEFQQLIAELQ